MFEGLYAFWADWRNWVYSDPVALGFVYMLTGCSLIGVYTIAEDLVKGLRKK